MPGDERYQIQYLEAVVKEDISHLPKKLGATIKKVIAERLMVEPIDFGKPLRYSLKRHRRLQVSHYRVVYRVESNSRTVVIVATQHRK